MTGALWSARLLRDDPQAITGAHGAFLAAGARVITTASYQATFEGFARAGVLRSTRPAVADAVLGAAGPGGRSGSTPATGPPGWPPRSARTARCSPTARSTPVPTPRCSGPAAAGGAPELRAFHRPRLALLAEAGADVLAWRRSPAAEAEALVTEAAALGVPPGCRSPRCSPARRRAHPPGRTRGGGVRAGPRRRRDLAVGVNCTDPAGSIRPSKRLPGRRDAGCGLPEQRRDLGRRRPRLDRLGGVAPDDVPGDGGRRARGWSAAAAGWGREPIAAMAAAPSPEVPKPAISAPGSRCRNGGSGSSEDRPAAGDGDRAPEM